MDIIANLGIGFETVLQPVNIWYCFLGALLGTMIGVLPGVGPVATIAMLLPITFTLEPVTGLITLAGVYYGAQYGGSTTAILLNLPGEASSAVTTIDGYQMARNGRAGPALAIAAIGSFVAGTITTLIVAFAAPLLSALALQFRSPEYFSLIVVGLICSVVLARGSVVKALAMIVIGLLLGIVGLDVYTATPRFTFGSLALTDGVNFVALAVGVFGVAEILRNLERTVENERTVVPVGRIVPTRQDIRDSSGPILRGTGLGAILGVLPGGGSLLSSFASYALEKRLARNPEEFGKGAIQGVAGPESANNAGSQASFIPMLTLGIPSNAVMALMVGALIVQGIVPGPNVMRNQPDLVWGLIVSMWLGNLMLLVLNLPLVGLWVKFLSIRYIILVPAIMTFSAIGIYSVNNSVTDMYTLIIFGLVGYGLLKLDCEPTPLILGFVLGSLFENNLRRALSISGGDWSILVQDYKSVTLYVLAVLVVIAPIWLARRARRMEGDATSRG